MKYRNNCSNSNIVKDCNINQNNILEIELDYLQTQLNILSKNMNNLQKKEQCKDNRYDQIIREFNNVYTILGSNNDTLTTLKQVSDDCCRIVYTDVTTTHQFIVEEDISLLFITMVGGGGAGGVGCVDGFYYYSGGGGGSGSPLIKKPINVCMGSTINIIVGRGAKYPEEEGQASCIIVETMGKDTITIKADGGKSGHPHYNMITKSVNGGAGGVGINCILHGCPGEDGAISNPSQIPANGGNGASSFFCIGGRGGSSYFNIGGEGGDEDNIIGQNGNFGSGGGGSAPHLILDITQQLSGNGGDGIIIIEW